MKTTIASPTPSAILTGREENIQRLSAGARAAFDRFEAGGDPAVLDPVLLGILEDFMPRSRARPLAGAPGSTQLIKDLGFDSLAIAEVVFFAEELFGIDISNEEIVRVRTLDDLRGFIRGKVGARPAT